MSTKNSRLPSYEELFGKLDFQKGDEARSVYSPAAYLADLLQLLDDNFVPNGSAEHPDLHQRRPDIQAIPLNAENTFTEAPYLDIVNTVLANAIGGDAYATLKTSRYPLHLPFHLENEQFKKYLHALEVAPAQLYQQFAPQPDLTLVARERLGLSQEEYAFVTTELSAEAAVKAGYGLSDRTPLSELLQIELFLKTTGLSGQELRELLFHGLGDAAQGQAAAFFINHELGGYMELGEDEATLVWHGVPEESDTTVAQSDQPQSILVDWFDRVNRFVMLAHKIGFTFSELDLALRSCCHNQLNEAAIRTLAVIQHLREQYMLSLDVVCSFFNPPSIMGIGDEVTPTDLLAVQNKENRRRLAKALGLSEKDLIAIVTQFGNKLAADQSASIVSSISKPGLAAFLYRVSALAEVLDISPVELFCLLDIVEKDPSIRTYNNFNLLIESEQQALDCYKMLADGDVSAIIWLVQLLFAIVQWMQANSFGSEELAQILNGRDKTPAEQTRRRNQKIAVLDNLYQQFKPVMVDAGLFVSDRFDERSARVIFETVTAAGAGLASKQDRRLVRFDPALAAAAAYQALTQLAVIRTADFMQLGLEERLLDKIFRNLIIREYLTTEGKVIEERLPKHAADFVLASDFQAQQEALFMIIHDLYSDEDREEALNAAQDAVMEVALYPSDLEALEELTTAQRNELYDNLIFNGYLDTDGTILRADFFVLTENVADFAVNVDLRAVADAVFEQIVSQIQQFAAAPLALEVGIFAELPLTPAEVEALVENLRFNEYLDANNLLVNKGALLSQNVAEFNLALAFYPLRSPILEAIQQFIDAFQAGFYTLTRETFRAIADAVVAQQVVAHLEREYLRNGRPDEAMQAFFLDPANKALFQVGPDFTAADNALIFDHIAALLIQQQPYQLPVSSLADHGFDAEEMAELLEVLRVSAHVTDGLLLPENEIRYFLHIDNALEFSIEAFEDYNKDIFFMLHDVAKETAAAIDEIVETLNVRAQNQVDVVLEVLQEAFVVFTTVQKTCATSSWKVMPKRERDGCP